MSKETRPYIIPAAGRLVRDPERGGHLAEGGRHAVLTTYWCRREREGSVFIADTKTQATALRDEAARPAPKSKSKE